MRKRILETKKNSVSTLLGVGMIFLFTLTLVFKTTSIKVEKEVISSVHSSSVNNTNFQLTPLTEIVNHDFYTSENEEKSDDDESTFRGTLGFFQFLFPHQNENHSNVLYNIAFFKTTPLFLLFGQLKIPFC